MAFSEAVRTSASAICSHVSPTWRSALEAVPVPRSGRFAAAGRDG